MLKILPVFTVGLFPRPCKQCCGEVCTYLLTVDLTPDHDGRWQACIPALPGCVARATTREEALEALTRTAHTHVRAILAEQGSVPADLTTTGAPLIAITI